MTTFPTNDVGTAVHWRHKTFMLECRPHQPAMSGCSKDVRTGRGQTKFPS